MVGVLGVWGEENGLDRKGAPGAREDTGLGATVGCNPTAAWTMRVLPEGKRGGAPGAADPKTRGGDA